MFILFIAIVWLGVLAPTRLAVRAKFHLPLRFGLVLGLVWFGYDRNIVITHTHTLYLLQDIFIDPLLLKEIFGFFEDFLCFFAAQLYSLV